MKKNSFADILSGLESDLSRRAEAKIPSLAGIRIPGSLALEQCSSEAAALYKASVALKFTGRARASIADLTGGLGIDSWAFARTFDRVFYNEMNAGLADAVKGNYAGLGIDNVSFHNYCISPQGTEWVEALEAFGPDAIYLDPARRSSTGRKVFLLEECSPDVLQLVDSLSAICPKLILKLSPMADISLITNRLTDKYRSITGHNGLKEIQVIGIQGECKELLCLSDASWDGPCSISAVELKGKGSPAIISPGAHDTPVEYVRPEDLATGRLLAVPSAILVKAGFHDTAASDALYRKADRFTHLYFTDKRGEDPEDFFKYYEIVEIKEFSNSSLKEYSQRYPGADASAKNIPLTSEGLRLRLGQGKASGDGTHIFGFSTATGRYLAACRPLVI